MTKYIKKFLIGILILTGVLLINNTSLATILPTAAISVNQAGVVVNTNSSIVFTSTVAASKFIGDGSLLTNLNNGNTAGFIPVVVSHAGGVTNQISFNNLIMPSQTMNQNQTLLIFAAVPFGVSRFMSATLNGTNIPCILTNISSGGASANVQIFVMTNPLTGTPIIKQTTSIPNYIIAEEFVLTNVSSITTAYTNFNNSLVWPNGITNNPLAMQNELIVDQLLLGNGADPANEVISGPNQTSYDDLQDGFSLIGMQTSSEPGTNGLTQTYWYVPNHDYNTYPTTINGVIVHGINPTNQINAGAVYGYGNYYGNFTGTSITTSTGTNTFTMGSTGYTNKNPFDVRIFELQGTSITFTNLTSKVGFSIGTISVNNDFLILHTNECVQGTGMTGQIVQ